MYWCSNHWDGFNCWRRRKSIYSDDILGLSFGLIAAAFYAALLLLNKFIKDMGKLELTIIQLGTTALLLMPYVFFT